MEDFDLDMTPITSIDAVKNMVALKKLNLCAYFGIRDISPLANLVALEELWMEGHSVTCITPLSNLQRLKVLAIGHGPLIDITPLSTLILLERLYLSQTKVKSIEPLANLVALERLALLVGPLGYNMSVLEIALRSKSLK